MISHSLDLVRTEDGSHTLFQSQLKEHYHSVFGAINESECIYINAGLRAVRGRFIKILEVGLGTGLNLLLTYRESINKDLLIYYNGIEPYPISETLASKINYSQQLQGNISTVFNEIHSSLWNEPTSLCNQMLIKKLRISIQEFTTPLKYDLIYFDAFSPKSQPEMWSVDVLTKLYSLLSFNGLLVTYSSNGDFRRNLKKIGFHIESLAGPNGKREITRARKPEPLVNIEPLHN